MSASDNRRARLSAHGIPSPDYCVTRHGSQWRVKVDFNCHTVQQYYSSRDDAIAARDSIVQAIIDTGDISSFRSWKPFPTPPPSKKEQRWDELRNQIKSAPTASGRKEYDMKIITAREYNYNDLIEQYKAAPSDLKPAALNELGEWFRCYSEGRCWNGEYWDCPEAGIRIRPVYIYNAETDEYDCTDDFEEV